MKRRSFVALLVICLMLACLFACTPIESNNEPSDSKQDQSSAQPLTQYSITYDLDGGSASNPATYTEADEFYLSSPAKEGYSFVGWTYDGKTEPELNVKIAKGTTGDKHFTAHYEVYDFEPLKIAVFADIQLTTGDRQAGSVANAVIALRDHFKYAKSIGADVLLMSGDIINNAVESYYELYESILKDVYGEDESAYPEFVMNMGNHEWWDRKENETPEAVSMFRSYARIESPCLVKQSSTPYYLDESTMLPSYYKVVKGVPFLVVSADNSSGTIGPELKAELASWLREIAELESVKKGGPIYVSYHYPIPGVTLKGEHATANCAGIDELLKDYPSAIVFTGDTHFSGVNERTINQIDYTSINIGSSSYSRSISESATGYNFDNVNKGSGKSSAGTMKGDVAFKYEYTPTIMIVNMASPEKTTIDRYFTADNVADAAKVGMTWEIPQIKSKSDFVYTDDRIQNTAWANALYGKNGLTWASGETVRYNVSGSSMMINFNDVTDYNCAEHYRIEVKDGGSAQNVAYYDYLSPYYRYENEAHEYNYVLENVFTAASYTVTVTAYDFFDNPSLTTLRATAPDATLAFPDMIDVKTLDAYSDISRRVNFTETAEGSNSSVEYFYQGTKRFSSGMTLNRLVLENSDTTLEKYLSVIDWSDAVLSFKVKNPNDFELYFAPTVVTKVNGTEEWLSDGSRAYRVAVPAHSDWTTVKWSLAAQFGITSDIVSNLAVKVVVPDSVVDEINGYRFTFYLDDIDVVSDSVAVPHEYKFENTLGEDFYGTNLFNATLNSVLSFEYQLVTPADEAENSTFAFMVYDGNVWANYVNYITFNPYTNTSSVSNAVITPLADGWYNFKVDLSTLEVVGDRDVLSSAALSYIYAPSGRVNCVIYLDNFTVETPSAHKVMYSNMASEPTMVNVFSATTANSLKFYYKAEAYDEANPSGSHFAFMIFDGDDWQNWLGYIEINFYKNRGSSGVTITEDEDGWYEVVVDISQLTVHGNKDLIDRKTLDSVYFRPANQSGTVSVSAFTVE